VTIRIIRIDIASKLSDADWLCVESYKLRSSRLAQTSLVEENNTGKLRWSMSMTAKGLSCEGDLPREAFIVEHLAALRFFYLEKEPSFFLKVVNVLSKNARSDEATAAFRQIKAEWKTALFKESVKIEWHEGKITAAGLLDLWFNGEYFHGDKDARDALRSLWETIPEKVTRWLLIEAALGSSCVVMKLNTWLEGLVRRAET